MNPASKRLKNSVISTTWLNSLYSQRPNAQPFTKDLFDTNKLTPNSTAGGEKRNDGFH